MAVVGAFVFHKHILFLSEIFFFFLFKGNAETHTPKNNNTKVYFSRIFSRERSPRSLTACFIFPGISPPCYAHVCSLITSRCVLVKIKFVYLILFRNYFYCFIMLLQTVFVKTRLRGALQFEFGSPLLDVVRFFPKLKRQISRI